MMNSVIRPLTFHAAVAAAALVSAGVVSTPAAETGVTATLDPAAKKVRIEAGGSLFAELIYAGQPKPVLFPVHGPDGTLVVRQWPLGPAASGEEKDHPHHKGMWFTHGSVNGVDFWTERPEAGKILVQGEPEILPGSPDKGRVTVKTAEVWKKPDGATLLTSATTIVFGTEGGDRFVDYSITLSPPQGEVILGDTKEGTMGLRLSKAFNFKNKGDTGSVLTSEGKSGKAAWGTRARWVDYHAPAGRDGAVLGVACFDHPSNLRHPTTWHARDYGLVAANPFGLHDFLKHPQGAGDYLLKKDQPLTLRYRWLFHRGTTEEAGIESRWKAWAAGR